MDKMNQGNDETQSLPEAMEAVLVELWRRSAETLEIRELMEYSDPRRYREQVRTWAKNRNWEETLMIIM